MPSNLSLELANQNKKGNSKSSIHYLEAWQKKSELLIIFIDSLVKKKEKQ